MEISVSAGKNILNLKKKNILGIAISVLYIGEDDDRETKQCYIWNTNTKEKEQQFCY